MKSNDKTTEEISNFSSFYVDLVQQREPNTYAWSHFQKGDNIVLIERYKDEAAHLNHIKNISPGGISEKEAPIDISNLSLFTTDGKITRIGYRVEDGNKVRYAKKTNEVI